MEPILFQHRGNLRRKLLTPLAAWLAFAFFSTAGAQQTPQAGQVDPSFGASLGLAGNVSVVCPQPDGKLLVAGGFLRHLVRLNADGSVDPTFNSSLDANASVNQVALLPTGSILIAGGFTAVDGVPRNGLARLDADGSLDSTFDPGGGTNSAVLALELETNGDVLIGGGFISVNGVARNGIVRLDAGGSVDLSFDPGLGVQAVAGGAYVDAIAVQPDGGVLIGGNFETVNGTPRGGIARLAPGGSLDSAFDPGPGVTFNGGDGTVNALALQGNGKVLIGGGFDTVEGVARSAAVARLNADGSLDHGFDLGTGLVGAGDYAAYVDRIVWQPNGSVLIGGLFATNSNLLFGEGPYGIARLHPDGSLDAGFTLEFLSLGKVFTASNAVDYVSSLALQADGKIIIGGDFAAVGGVLRNGVARLDADGSVDSSFAPDNVAGPNLPVLAFAVQPDGKVLIAGEFTSISGVLYGGFARLNSDGSLDQSFNSGTGADNPVYCLGLEPDGPILMGGTFDTVDSFSCSGLAYIATDGDLELNLNLGTGTGDEGGVGSIALQPDGKVILGGSFEQFNGEVHDGLVRLAADGSIDPTFVANAIGGSVSSVVLQPDGKTIVGGYFSTVDGTSRSEIARLNADGSLDPSFDPGDGVQGGANGAGVQAVALQPDGMVLIGGYFTQVDGVTCNGLARLRPDGSPDPSFDPGLGVQGGSFVDEVFALAVQSDGRIIVGGAFTAYDGVSHNGIARLNVDGSLDPAFAPDFDGAGIGAITVRTDGTILVGGEFTTANGLVRNYVALLNADGSTNVGFDPSGGDAAINALVLQSDNTGLFVGGDFITLQGRPINSLARLFESDGSLDTTFAPTFAAGETVYALALQQDTGQPDNGDVLVSSIPPAPPLSTTDRITSALSAKHRGPQTQSAVHNPIHRCNYGDGSFDPTFNANAGTDGTAFALGGLPGGLTLVGGSFANLNGAPRSNLARLTLAGDLDPAFIATANGAVRTVDVSLAGTDSIYVAGDFTQIDGVSRNGVARLHADGGLDATFDPGVGPNGSVSEILADHGNVYIAGNFTAVDSQPRGGHALLNGNGTLNTGYAPGPTLQAHPPGTRGDAGRTTATRSPLTTSSAQADPTPALVTSLDVQTDGKVIIGGLFSQVGGNVARNNVARFNPDGSVDPTFEPGAGPSAQINALKLQPDGRTLIGGNFTSVDGLERRGAARLLGDPATVTVAAKHSEVTVPTTGKAKFILTRAGGDLSSSLTVTYVLRGSAQESIDYLSAAGQVAFAANATTAQVKVKLIKTGTPAAPQSILKLKLKTGPGYVLDATTDKASVTITRLP